MATRFLVAGRTGGDPKTADYWAFVDHVCVVTPLDNLIREVISEARRRGIKITGEKPDIEQEINDFLKSAAI